MNFARDFTKNVEKAMTDTVRNHIREKLGTIRHPETGEFPTVVILGNSLDHIQARVEGSPELMELIRKKISEEKDYEDLKGLIMTEEKKNPKAFFSYATEDRDLAAKIASEMQSNGIDTWWAEWEIGAGDSLRQKIDEGLGVCTHFVVLLSPTSINKPWVNQEMDAGLIRKLKSECKFIPLRFKLPANELPPLLSGIHSPEINNLDADIPNLINDIHGVSKKPPLGSPPEIVQDVNETNTGYSAAATAVAKVFVENSTSAVFGDAQFMIDELMERTGLSRDDIEDGLYELNGMVNESHNRVLAKDELYATFDKYWMEWNPEEDALKIAADTLNDENFPSDVAQIAERYGWEPRRMNAALAYLQNREIIRERRVIGCQPWLISSVIPTPATRRFVKSRQ